MSRFPWIRAALPLLLLAACSGRPEHQENAGEPPQPAVTAQAHRLISIVADSTGTPAYEARRGLARMGRDAVPAIVEAIDGPLDTADKQNLMAVLGDFGLGATDALADLQRWKTSEVSAIGSSANYVLQRIQLARSCGLPDMPRDAKVHVVASYHGDQELDVQLGDSGHQVQQIEVVVDHTATPVVLVLTAYDPVVWRVGLTSGAQLAGVLVSGYHTQALVGIPSSIPHRVISGEQTPDCDAFHGSGVEDTNQIEPSILRLTGHSIDAFETRSSRGVFEIGDSEYAAPSGVRYSDDLSLEDYPVYSGEIPAGVRGLEELERQGKLRRATPQELQQWASAHPDHQAVFQGESLYVVVEALELPPGLFGAHSRRFVIPRGVPTPAGPKGHCSFVFLEDFRIE